MRILMSLALIACFVLSSKANANGLVLQQWGALNQKIMLKTGTMKLSKEMCASTHLWKYIYAEPYIRVVKYKVRPGSRYTAYAYYHTGKSEQWGKRSPMANVYCLTYNPFSKLKTKNGEAFYFWGQSPYKTPTGWTARRINFTIDSKSTGDAIYLIMASKNPSFPNGGPTEVSSRF